VEADFQPFIGPRPFTREDRDRFFGRTREILDLASLVIAHPIVFLYGQSGTGKTSLVHAGLIPKLEVEEGFIVLPVVRPGSSVEQVGAEQTTSSPFVYSTLRTWSGGSNVGLDSIDGSLADYLAGLTPERDEEGDPKPRLLIFDQLEEVFQDQVDAFQEQLEFFTQIGEVLHRARRTDRHGTPSTAPEMVPTRVLLAMREEYIAELDSFAALLPERLRIRFRLERLRTPAALEAVTRPLRMTSLAFAPDVAERLIADLREVRIETGVGEARRAVNVLGEFVEPVQLQVVCERLVRDLPPGSTEITFEHLSTFGSVDTTLSQFYKDAVAFAAQRSGVPQDDLERWCETSLITQTGTRAVVHRGPTQSNGVPNAAPDALVERLLLRREPRSGADWYELTHDRLIGPIQAARLAREHHEAEERQAEEARRRHAAERRVRLLVAGLALATVAAYITAILYFGGQRPDCTGTLVCVWRFRTDGEVFGRPALAGAVAYVPSTDGGMYAIDTSQPEQLFPFVGNGASRQQLWRFATGGPVWSSPALVDGIIYVGSEDTNLYALDAVTGREVDATAGPATAAASDDLWPVETGGAIVTSPAVVDGVVYFGSFDQHLYAVAADSGKELWRFRTRGPVVSSPTVVAGVIYVGSNDNSLYAIDSATGQERWRLETDGEVRSTPAVVDGVVYVGSFDSNIYAIDAATGTEHWRFPTGERVRSSPAVVDGIVYVGSNDTLVYALDARTGREVWRFPTEGWVVASPLVHDGVVYVGSNDGRFYAIDALSGREIGRLFADGVVESFPAAHGNQIIFGSGGGSVYAVDQVSSGGEGPAPLGTPALPDTTPADSTPGRATPVSPRGNGPAPVRGDRNGQNRDHG
jgi:outer membrane protein assembly factor BamB